MKGKRLLALALSAAMVTGSSVTVFAADEKGGEQGKGELQYVATSDVFRVVLPVEKAEGAASTFDYIIDPDGLIAATKDQTDKRYTGTFEAGKTVYFKHATAVGGNDYTDTSDELTVTNKSTQDVVLTVTAKVAEADGVTMDADGTFSAATGAGNLYMALKGKVSGETNDTTTVITAEGVKVDVTIPKDPSAYEVKWNATAKQYEKALTAAASATDGSYTDFKTYTFKLTGACKANDAALLALKENPPKVDLTWSVKDFTVTAPTTVTGTRITNGSGAQVYNTSAALATRLKSGSVQFLFDNVTNDVSGLAVSKIVIDGTEYDTSKITVTSNASANASSDGKLYQLTGFTAATANEVEVYYGNSILVKYTLN